MNELAVEIKNLNYAFYDAAVLQAIDLEIESNKIYGLIGKNGAGKTTLINLIANQLIAKQGIIQVLGKDPRKEPSTLENLCVVREGEFYAPRMKVKDIFKLYRILYKHYDETLEKRLVDFFKLPTHKAYQKYSRGMKSMVFIIIGICSRAPITIFDEPTLGLDAGSREDFYKILLEDYLKHPRTIILSTHLIDEVEHLIERVILIDEGRVALNEEVQELKEQAYYITASQEKLEKLEVLRNKPPKKCYGKTSVYAYFGSLSKVDKEIIKSEQIEIVPMSLQQIFLEHTKRREFKDE